MYKFILSIVITLCLALSGCKEHKNEDVIKFGTAGDYPPFEYRENGELVGFDIELGKLIAKELGKKAEFQDMTFNNILGSIQTDTIDAGISTITVTEDRAKNFDFSNNYYTEVLALIYQKNAPLNSKEQMINKKIAVQLGTAMEIWLKQNLEDESKILAVDDNNLAVESLKAGHVDGVLIDEFQAKEFSKKNLGLAYSIIAKTDNGYAVAVKKGSPLKEQINNALKNLEAKGEIEKLKQHWIK